MRLRGAQTHSTVLAVAQEVGFASPEVFCRAFKAHFGMAPSAWKRGGFVRCALSTPDGVIMELSICQLSPVRVAYMRHIGPYGHPGIPLLTK